MSEKLQHKKRLWRANSNQKSCAPEERGLLTVKMLNKNQETTMREGLRACKRVAFLRRRHKNAECIARCIRFPGAMPRARGNNWALHNVGCARHSPNKFGSALACTTFQPALTIAIRRVRRASSQSSSYSLTAFWQGSSDAPPSARPFRCAGARDRGLRTGNRG